MTTTLRELDQNIRDEVRDYADELFDSAYPEDRLHEMADGSVPVYYSTLLELAADSNHLATDEPDMGPAFDGSPTPVNIIAANVYEYLLAAAYEEWRDVQEEREAGIGEYEEVESA